MRVQECLGFPPSDPVLVSNPHHGFPFAAVVSRVLPALAVIPAGTARLVLLPHPVRRLFREHDPLCFRCGVRDITVLIRLPTPRLRASAPLRFLSILREQRHVAGAFHAGKRSGHVPGGAGDRRGCPPLHLAALCGAGSGVRHARLLGLQFRRRHAVEGERLGIDPRGLGLGLARKRLLPHLRRPAGRARPRLLQPRLERGKRLGASRRCGQILVRSERRRRAVQRVPDLVRAQHAALSPGKLAGQRERALVNQLVARQQQVHELPRVPAGAQTVSGIGERRTQLLLVSGLDLRRLELHRLPHVYVGVTGAVVLGRAAHVVDLHAHMRAVQHVNHCSRIWLEAAPHVHQQPLAGLDPEARPPRDQRVRVSRLLPARLRGLQHGGLLREEPTVAQKVLGQRDLARVVAERHLAVRKLQPHSRHGRAVPHLALGKTRDPGIWNGDGEGFRFLV